MMRTPALGLVAPLAAALFTAMGGCAGAPPGGVTASPRDFSLDALVVVPDGSEASPSAPRSRRPGRYQLAPDGSLRVALGPGVDAETIPALARRLTPAERDELYRLTGEAGLLEDDPPGRIAWGGTWQAPPVGASAIVSVTHGGRRVHVGAPLGARYGSPRVEALVDRLAALAWEPSTPSWVSAPTDE